MFEFVAAGGSLTPPVAPALRENLRREGTAMLSAVCHDLARLARTTVYVLADRHSPLGPSLPNVVVVSVQDDRSLWREFERLAADSDYTLVIAPDFAGILLGASERVEAVGGNLLSPPSHVVCWAVNKQKTVSRLQRAGIPVPLGRQLEFPPATCDEALRQLFPAVLKPIDGAGSMGVCLRNAPHELRQADLGADWRLEKFHPGQPASVALLTGPAGAVHLAPCTQQFSNAIHFPYEGGQLIHDENLIERAEALAARVARVLTDSIGYVGIDMVLGADRDGSEDVVIEINPRVTTSYVGLRAAYRENLGAAMLAIARGEVPALTRRSGPVRFTSQGLVEVG